MRPLTVLVLVCMLGMGDVQAQDEAMAEMMAAYMQYADPDEHHERLATSVGAWNIEGQFRMGPDAEWQTTMSRAEIEPILGGRFFVQRVTGPAMMEGGHPFEGFGISGYDRIQEKYITAWAENHGTMMMMGTGTADESGNVITTELTYLNPMTRQPSTSRWVVRYNDDDTMTFEMHEQGEDGAFYMSGLLTYTRSAPAKAGLEKLKSLEGTWSGDDPEGRPVTVTYEVVSGGTAVLEKIAAEGEPDMVTMYHLDGEHLMLTHYCSMGNQPRMRAQVPAGALERLDFAFVDATNVAADEEGHIRHLTVTFTDERHLTQVWTWRNDDGEDVPGTFALVRMD